MDKETLQLLERIFENSLSDNEAVSAKRFRADNYSYIEVLDELQNKQYIEIRDGKYYIKLVTLLEISKDNKKAENILFLTESIFRELHSFYREDPGGNIALNELAKRADITRSDINKGLSYMLQSHIFGGYTTKYCEESDATVTPGERILKFNSFKEVIEDIEKMQHASFVNNEISTYNQKASNPFENHDFINQERIASLELLVSDKYDFKRLITICNEINSCATNENYFALGMLIRTLLNHVPPIFGKKTFKEVATNYATGKSIKKSFDNLERSSRNISDGILHQVIRKKESLPTINQVNFSPDIDVLIAEIIRIIEEDDMLLFYEPMDG